MAELKYLSHLMLIIPMIALRETTMLPDMIIHFDINKIQVCQENERSNGVENILNN
ncbi:MAG: hypothetical protein HUJ74_03185 [Lachnospiraceae bacterium]|nr:hypothetical protein [Lachnospiraceae bacterium]